MSPLFRQLAIVICGVLATTFSAAAQETATPQKLAVGSVIQYQMTILERNTQAAAPIVSSLDLLETKFAARFLGSQFFAYYDRQSLRAVQTEMNRINSAAFDKMTGPLRDLLKRLDYLAVFSSGLQGPPTVKIIEVETGRVFASEVCGRAGDFACVDTVYRQLLSMASEILVHNQGQQDRRAALEALTPQYEQLVGRVSAENQFWTQIRTQSRTRVLRPEIESLLKTIQVGSDRCAVLIRDADSRQLGGCITSVNANLDKLAAFK